MVKKSVNQETDKEPTNLRRSTRSTRGSVKPVVDLGKQEQEQEEEEEESLTEVDGRQPAEADDEEFKLENKRKSSASRNSAVRQDLTKREPARRRQSTKGAVKKEPDPESTKVTKREVENLDEGDEQIGDVNFYELSESELIDINHAFNMNRISDDEESLDINGLRTAIRSLGFEPRGDEIKRLFKNFSNKKGNKVNRDGFQKIMALKFGSSPGTKLNNLNDEISKVFNLLDLDKTGMITIENLKSISKELNEDLNDDDIVEMVQEADLDGDNMINKMEFERIMKKTSLY